MIGAKSTHSTKDLMNKEKTQGVTFQSRFDSYETRQSLITPGNRDESTYHSHVDLRCKK